jgi:D-sedoheptulose 7-phosphate isomerase
VSPESTDFLYPFIEGDETDATSLLADLARSADEKSVQSDDLARSTLATTTEQLVRIAAAMAERFDAGAQLFTCGNGGSATDAAGVASLFARPPAGRPLPARSLVADEAVLTALANDVGFDVVFSRQLIAHARPGDIVVGFSTSGNSENVIRAFEEAAGRGLLTVGFAGYDGGQMAACDALQHLVVVRSDSVHRIQEAQSRTAYVLWEHVQEELR